MRKRTTLKDSKEYVFKTNYMNTELSIDIIKTIEYVDMISHHGLQCNKIGKEHSIILKYVSKAVNLMKIVTYLNDYTNEEIKDLFCKRYDLIFHNWIEKDIADFKYSVFSVEQMAYGLSFNFESTDCLSKKINATETIKSNLDFFKELECLIVNNEIAMECKSQMIDCIHFLDNEF